MFAQHARIVAAHPWPFVLLPLLVTAVCAGGFIRNPPLIKDELDLYTPLNAPARRELATIQQLYTVDDNSPFYAYRRCARTHAHIHSYGRFDMQRVGHLIMTVGEYDNVLTRPHLDTALRLWQSINEINVAHQRRTYNYSQLCVRVIVPRADG
jgi:hypothetical protein